MAKQFGHGRGALEVNVGCPHTQDLARFTEVWLQFTTTTQTNYEIFEFFHNFCRIRWIQKNKIYKKS